VKQKSPENPILVKNPETREGRRCKRKLEAWNINTPRQLSMREIINKEQSMEKNHTFDV